MQQEILTIINQIFRLLLLGVIGYVVGKTKYLPLESSKVLSSVVVRLTAPLMIATKLFYAEFDGKDFEIGIKMYFITLLIYFVIFLMARLVSRLMKLPFDTRNVFTVASMFGNTVYFALPLIDILYGSTGVAYSLFFVLANDTLLWTLGLYLLTSKEEEKGKTNLKNMINGNTIAFFIGIIFLITSAGQRTMAMPDGFIKDSIISVMEVLSSLGATTSIFSMIFIGLMLSQINLGSFKEFFRRKHIFVLALIKLIVFPLTAIAVLKILGNTFISPLAAIIIVMQCAMPCATLVPALSAEYESDSTFATECVFITTVALVFTLPPMLMFMNLVLG